jgi:hypothetical protein
LLTDETCLFATPWINLVKLSIADEVKPNKTVICILPANCHATDGNVVAERRSMKAMQASLEGIPMISLSWIEACAKDDNQFVVPTPSMYVRSLPTKCSSSNAEFGVAKMAASFEHHSEMGLAAELRYAPLGNVYLYLCGFSCKNESDFATLARQAGVKEVITKPTSALSKLKAMKTAGKTRFVVMCNDSNVSISDAFVNERRSSHTKKDVMVVNSQWLCDSVSCAESLPPTSFKPQGCKIATELWNITCSAN